jgi:hypothetical protein
MDNREVKPPRKKTGPKGPSKPMAEKELAQLISMIKIHCTRDEICSILGMSDTTLNRRIAEQGIPGVSNFEALYEKHAANGKASLRRMQWKAAEDGNVTALIWLGKQVLGQTDQIKQQVEVAARVETVDYTKLSTEALLELRNAMTDAAPANNDSGS